MSAKSIVTSQPSTASLLAALSGHTPPALLSCVRCPRLATWVHYMHFCSIQTCVMRCLDVYVCDFKCGWAVVSGLIHVEQQPCACLFGTSSFSGTIQGAGIRTGKLRGHRHLSLKVSFLIVCPHALFLVLMFAMPAICMVCGTITYIHSMSQLVH